MAYWCSVRTRITQPTINAAVQHGYKIAVKYQIGLNQYYVRWQKTSAVLGLFGKMVGAARKRYKTFVAKGISMGRRSDLTGGGLVRSAGGWEAVKQLRRAKDYQKGDERILGGGEFVQSVLFHAQESIQRKYRLTSAGLNQQSLAQQAAELIGIDQALIKMPNKQPKIVAARSLYCY